jgi:RecA-family ATPase
MSSDDEVLFDGAVQKAIGDVLASMRQAFGGQHQDDGARNFAIYTALRAGAASLDAFDDMEAVHHVLAMATAAYGLDVDIAQHAVAEGLRDADKRRDAEKRARTNGHAGPTTAKSPNVLKFLDMSTWDDIAPPERVWGVLDRIPAGQVTLLSGEGSIGKTILELMLCVAHAIGADWIGSLPEKGPVIYLGAEDDADELHRRLYEILQYFGIKFRDLINNGFHILSLAGEDALLGTANRNGQVAPTRLYQQLLEAVQDIRPKHIGIDTSADVFGGNEIDRAQVRQFIGLLRKLAIACSGSVVLLAHPSLEGIRSGSGISGSTGWHNSVRARMYFKTAQATDDEADNGLRVLEFKKNNYGPIAHNIKLEYHKGIFRPVGTFSSVEQLARERRVETVFLDVFGKLIGQGWQTFSIKARAADEYVPRMIARHANGKEFQERDYAAAMQRLIESNQVHIEIVKRDRKPRECLAMGPKPIETPSGGLF